MYKWLLPTCLGSTYEELRSVSVRASVGHWEDSFPGVLQWEVLIGKLLSVDRLPAGPVSPSKITSLTHETRYYPVKWGALESKAFLSGTKCTEVLCSNDVLSIWKIYHRLNLPSPPPKVIFLQNDTKSYLLVAIFCKMIPKSYLLVVIFAGSKYNFKPRPCSTQAISLIFEFKKDASRTLQA